MRTLPLTNPTSHYLQSGFQSWLETLGYSSSIIYGLPCYQQEFLHYLEQQDFDFNWSQTPVNNYLEYLKTRRNTRRGGGLSNHSINNHMYMLSKFSEYLFKVHGKTLPVALQMLEIPFQPDLVLSKTAISQLYMATGESPLGSRDRAMLSIFYGCGLRRSEGERLDVEDIMLEKEALVVKKSKNGKGRIVPLSHGVKHHLADYLSYGRPQLQKEPTEQAFFLNRSGDRIKGGNLYLRFKKLLCDSDLPEYCLKAGLHTLRHSIATHLLEGGMKIEDVSLFLGHSSLESTQRYIHICANLKK